MSTISINDFTGITPRRSESLLEPNGASVAQNVKLQSGEIRAWRDAVAVAEAPHGTKSIFKMDGDDGTTAWLSWSVDTDVCYGPVADNGVNRIYYSEGGVCKKTNYAMATTGTGALPRNWYYMGVPWPVNAPVVDPDTPSSQQETEDRVYCYTYVSEFGGITEESAPSAGTTAACKVSGGTTRVKGFSNPPTDHYNITKIRIYRSITGSTTIAYMLVDEIALVNHEMPESGVSLNGVAFSNYTYPDTRTSAQLGKDLDSEYYTPPPEGLTGLVSMPNGFFAGFLNNQVWFSEPYLPHAWPSTYMLTVDSPIVGLGVYGNTLVVCTTRQPYTISGTHPDSMSQEKQPMMQPCMSKRSIAYDQYGVIYASSYGLVALAAGQMDVFTRPLLTSDDWQEYMPETMEAVMYNNLYITAYKGAKGVGALVFSRGDTPALVELDLQMACSHVERGTGKLFYFDSDSDTILNIDADDMKKHQYVWKSKRYTFPFWTSFTAMKLDAEYDANYDEAAYILERERVIEENEELFRDATSCVGGCINDFEFNGPSKGCINMSDGLFIGGCQMQVIPTKLDVRQVTVSIIADGKEIYARDFTSIKAVRVPAYKAHNWQIRFTGNINIRGFYMGTAMSDIGAPA